MPRKQRNILRTGQPITDEYAEVAVALNKARDNLLATFTRLTKDQKFLTSYRTNLPQIINLVVNGHPLKDSDIAKDLRDSRRFQSCEEAIEKLSSYLERETEDVKAAAPNKSVSYLMQIPFLFPYSRRNASLREMRKQTARYTKEEAAAEKALLNTIEFVGVMSAKRIQGVKFPISYKDFQTHGNLSTKPIPTSPVKRKQRCESLLAAFPGLREFGM